MGDRHLDLAVIGRGEYVDHEKLHDQQQLSPGTLSDTAFGSGDRQSQPIGDDASKPCRRGALIDIGGDINSTNWSRLLLGGLAELLGLTLIILIGGGTAASTAGAILPTAFAFGMALAFAIIVFGTFSGGHFNPGVTFGLLVLGHIRWPKALVYILAQAAASFVGALLLLLIFGDTPRLDAACTVVDAGSTGFYTAGNAFVVELLGAVILHWAVFRLTAHRVGLAIVALMLGLGFVGLELFGLVISGGSYNIFRSLGVAILADNFAPVVASSWWIYPVGHIAGALIAVVCEFVFRWWLDSSRREGAAAGMGKGN